VASATAALAASLALWLGLFPAVQAAHLALADHDHRFCDEHHRIEDVPRGSSRAAPTPPSTDAAPRLNGAPAARPSANPPDLLLSFNLGREPLLPSGQPAALRLAAPAPTVPPSRAGAVRARSLLLVAPKTSPPPVTA
jgi:hypothetical protein